MNRPIIKKRQWIIIGKPTPFSKTDGYVIDVHTDGILGVGYYKNKTKAIKSDVIWNGEYWAFKNTGSDGMYLRGLEEHIVKNRPLG